MGFFLLSFENHPSSQSDSRLRLGCILEYAPSLSLGLRVNLNNFEMKVRIFIKFSLIKNYLNADNQ